MASPKRVASMRPSVDMENLNLKQDAENKSPDKRFSIELKNSAYGNGEENNNNNQYNSNSVLNKMERNYENKINSNESRNKVEIEENPNKLRNVNNA